MHAATLNMCTNAAEMTLSLITAAAIYTTTGTLNIRYDTIQYNVLLLQSQRDRCDSDIHNDMYDSIADNCHAGQYCWKYCDYSDYR